MIINQQFRPVHDETDDTAPFFVVAKCKKGFSVVDAANGIQVAHCTTRCIAEYISAGLNFYEDVCCA